MVRLNRLLSVAPLVLLGGCGPFFVHGAVEELCYTTALQVPAAPVFEPAAATLTARLPVAYRLDDSLASAATSKLSIRLVSFEVAARGVPDLGFLDAFELRAGASCTGHRAAAVADGCPPGPVLLRSEGSVGMAQVDETKEPVDLAPSLREGALRLEAVLRGELPARDWDLETTVCVAVEGAL